MSPADADLVDGDLLQVLEVGLGEVPVQVTLLDVLDHVPTDPQVPGHILFALPGGMAAADFLETPLITTVGVGRRIARINRDLVKLHSAPPAAPLTVAGWYLELGFGLLSTICGISRETSHRNL